MYTCLVGGIWVGLLDIEPFSLFGLIGILSYTKIFKWAPKADHGMKAAHRNIGLELYPYSPYITPIYPNITITHHSTL